jgi:HlyD family secretion protein
MTLRRLVGAGIAARRDASLVPARLSALAPVVTGAIGGVIAALNPEPLPPARTSGDAEPVHRHLEHSLARELARGGRVLLVAAIAVLGWAGLVPLSGAVIVAGSLVVQGNVKKVQHQSGGIVTEVATRNGAKVAAGDVLARLDETPARTNVQVVARNLDEARLRRARLEAERDDRESPDWPASTAKVEAAERTRLIASEATLFETRAATRHGQRELSAARVAELEKEIAGLESQAKSNSRQLGITNGELKGVEQLLAQKLVTLPRATALQREAARLDGLDGQLAAQIAETRTKVSEARLQALQTEQSFRAEVMRDLREAEAKEGELAERLVAARDQLDRTTIRAPVTGTVHQLAVHTVGGVVAPAEVLMIIVPDGAGLEIDAHLPPDKIDQVREGQAAHVRLSAFNQRTTPELVGRVETVSADLVHEQGANAAYYDVRVALAAEEVARLGKLQLVAGMPAEVFLETGSRTMLSYLFKPMTDNLSRMFRER